MPKVYMYNEIYKYNKYKCIIKCFGNEKYFVKTSLCTEIKKKKERV